MISGKELILKLTAWFGPGRILGGHPAKSLPRPHCLLTGKGMRSARRLNTVLGYVLGMGTAIVEFTPFCNGATEKPLHLFQGLNSDKLLLTPLRGPQKKKTGKRASHVVFPVQSLIAEITT
jgi:hypothetical protein